MDNSEDFSFSVKAQNVEAKFYNKKAIVYVEGDDDLNFWRPYFPYSDFEIKKVDGCNNFKKKISEIENYGLRCIVACDSDYKNFENKYANHPLIVCTLSHSIECIMYCPVNINECIKKLSRTIDDKTENIEQCYELFGNDTKELIAYDIANNIHNIGIKVTGDSCCRFLRSNKSCQIDSSKISAYIESIKPYFTSVNIDEVLHMINTDGRNMRQITKGHFQTSFVVNLIKSLVRQISRTDISISEDSLYALLVNCTPDCNRECNEISVIKSRIRLACQFLNIV